jgi:phage terminase large subunit-like protein
MTHAQIATQYATNVVAGRIIACKWIKLACQRHLDDLETSTDASYPYKFDEAKASRVCDFIENLPHVKGKWAAKKELLKLQPWQIFAVSGIFAWVHKSTGLRKYREVYLLVPRKNGKSPLAAAIALYMLACDNEAGAEVYCGATSEKQAMEVFKPAKWMAERTPDLREALGIEVNAKSLVVTENGSSFSPVIGKPGDGASVSCGICDEYHEAVTPVLYDTFRTGMVGREQPLLLTISTAGFDLASPCYTLQLEAQKVLEGVLQNERMFVLIYTIDAETDWASEEAILMANPNHNVSVFGETLALDQELAVQDSAKQNVYKTKHLNVWCNANSTWINVQFWQKAADKSLEEDDFLNDPCWIGVDLASTVDLSAVVRIHVRNIEGKTHYFIFARHYLPEARINKPECQHYQKWHHDGHLLSTDGAAIDYAVIKSGLKADSETYQVNEICYDKTYCGQLMQELSSEGIVTVEVPQRVQFLSPAMKALEAAILDGRVHHNGDPVLNWCLSNVVAHPDKNDNLFPNKDKPELKIDAAVAMITAWNRVGTAGESGKRTINDVYEEREVRWL